MSERNSGCWECELELKYGGFDKIPEWEILSHGGCPYCSMTGYEDYPNRQIPCRIHKDLGQRIDRVNRAIIEGLRRPYTPEEGNCPYCLHQGKPVGIDCEHWTGVGWSRDGASQEARQALELLSRKGGRMDVKDVIAEKQKAEGKITELLCDLQKKTGLDVTQIAWCYTTQTLDSEGREKRLGLHTKIFMEL